MRIIITVLFLLLHAGLCTAQRNDTQQITTDSTAPKGTITGKVTDYTGDEIIGAIVVADRGGVEIAHAFTNYEGIYTIKNLPEGTYNLVAQYAGMVKETARDIKIKSKGGTSYQNICLKYKTKAGCPVIDIYNPVVDRTRPGIGTKYTSDQLERMR